MMRAAPSHRWSPPTSPLLGERWDADSHVFGFDDRGTWRAIGDLGARLREGERVAATDATRLGFYRPSSIRELMLRDDGLAPMPPSWGRLSPVGLGDVVLSKFIPVAAAWVSHPTPRRPIDSNCVRVIGLPSGFGFWIANVLEHPSYQAVLAHRAAGAALPRLGLRDLKALRIPDPPEGIDALVADWTRASRDLSAARDSVRNIQVRVGAWVDADAPPIPDAMQPHFHAPADIEDSLLPVHVVLRSFQADAARRGWRPLVDLLSIDSERLRGRRVAALRVLRLNDADGAFGFALPDLAELKHPTFRIYAHPLDPDEVLLSVLGSSPKVVFHHPPRQATVWLADHWARFRQTAEPGALALLLQSPAVAGQLHLAASGAARQFVARAELASIRVPWPDARTRRRWHTSLSSALERVHRATRRLAEVRAEVSALVDRHLGGRR